MHRGTQDAPRLLSLSLSPLSRNAPTMAKALTDTTAMAAFASYLQERRRRKETEWNNIKRRGEEKRGGDREPIQSAMAATATNRPNSTAAAGAWGRPRRQKTLDRLSLECIAEEEERSPTQPASTALVYCKRKGSHVNGKSDHFGCQGSPQTSQTSHFGSLHSV